MEKIKVLIVDDQRLMREGLQTILSFEDDIEVIGLAENGKVALGQIERNVPDVILMDIRMPELDGVQCTKEVLERHPRVKVIILTTFDEDSYVIDALKSGARGYLLKDMPSEVLIQAVRDAHRGVVLMQPDIALKLVSRADNVRSAPSTPSVLERLTKREHEILSLMARGLSNKEIAAELFISEGTVKNYTTTIYEKLCVKDRTQAVLLLRDSM